VAPATTAEMDLSSQKMTVTLGELMRWKAQETKWNKTREFMKNRMRSVPESIGVLKDFAMLLDVEVPES
jgi:hypothetical protein